MALLIIASLLASACSPGPQASAEPTADHPALAASQAQGAPTADARPGSPAPDLAANGAQQIERHRYSLEAAASALSPGVLPAFELVRDTIAFESYAGVLRGSAGTLAHGAGNAPDRALLLSDLLRSKGFSTRFVLGRLDAARAGQLHDGIFPRTAEPVEPGRFAPPASSSTTDPLLTRVHTRALRDHAAIVSALGDTAALRATAPRTEVLSEIAAHVWLQVHDAGTWRDLDPSFPGARPRQVFGAAERTLDDLPRDLHQEVVIRVVADVLAGSSLDRRTLLEASFRTETIVDRQIFLVHVPGAGKGGLAGGIEDALAGKDTWAPVLWVGGDAYGGQPVSLADEAATRKPGAPSGGFGSIFGAGGALSARKDLLVTEWLEIELRIPGREPEVIRRPLIDRAGEAWRQARDYRADTLRPLARDAEGPLDARILHNIWLSAGRHDLAAYADAAADFAELARAIGEAAPPPDLPFEDAVWPFALHNFTYFLVSDHALLPSLNDSANLRFYPDSPRVLIVSAGLRQRGAGRVFGIDYDVARNSIRAVAKSAAAEPGAVARKLWFGALEGALEHELGQRYLEAGRLEARRSFSTSAALGSAGAIVVRPPGDGLAEMLGHQDSAAEARRQLESGAILIVPRSSSPQAIAAWWSVDPRRSDVRAMLGNGGGAIMNDYNIGGMNRGRPSISGARWDTAGNRSGSRFGVQRTEKKFGPHEYFMMIASISIAVVLGAKLMVGFYQEVIVPTMSGQVSSALETGAAADRRHRW